jgi:hypothetical protein
MYSNTILKLDLIIIIIQKYCYKYLKPDKNIDKIKKSKTIQFVLDQLNDIRKTKDFKTLKSIFTIEKKYKIKDLKDWLNTLCANNFILFSKHFKLDVEIDMTKGYRTYVNLLSKLGNNKTKVDLRESNKKISILFNLLFYDVIVGGSPKPLKKVVSAIISAIKKIRNKTGIEQSDPIPIEEIKLYYSNKKVKQYIDILVAKKELAMKKAISEMLQTTANNKEYSELWTTLFEQTLNRDSLQQISQYLDIDSDIEIKIDSIKPSVATLDEIQIFIVLARAWTSSGDVYIKSLVSTGSMELYPIKIAPLIKELWDRLISINPDFTNLASLLEPNPRLSHDVGNFYKGYVHKYCIMLTFLAKYLYDNHIYPAIAANTSNSLTIFSGTNNFVINAISNTKHFLIPQSGSFNIENAGNFLNFENENVLMAYNFRITSTSTTNQLYLPVTITPISESPNENETLLVSMNYTLQPILNDEQSKTLKKSFDISETADIPETVGALTGELNILKRQQIETLQEMRILTFTINLLDGLFEKRKIEQLPTKLKLAVIKISDKNLLRNSFKSVVTQLKLTKEFRSLLISEEALDSLGSLGSFELD